ncbi:TolC family protein [Flavobacterium sp. NKUCC04_CG]|uniref:TolC family protein n=1 Tax=Flavobacterium sp. NKUCC04_CG TaxID=2842121 RepID=UPI001C5B3325|nr:TolC family protein [Flavobacterium sp. NKUCC04_CG]MBW3519655.1 TolC family protein [Flavobacterium sp. NKUCC04_CG]
MRKIKILLWGSLFVLAITTWSSCQITHPYSTPENHLDLSFRGPETSLDTITIASLPWTTIFTDTLLQSLIHEGLAANIDLKIAVERLTESKAHLRLQKSAYLPSLSSGISVKEFQLPHSQSFGNSRNNTQYDLGLQSNWEIDIWGKLGSSKRAALAQLLATDAAKKAVQTQLIADIASGYFQLLALDQELLTTQKTAKNRADDAAAIEMLFENALLNGVSVVQSQANYYEAELEIPDIEQRIKATEHQLCFLLGRNPESIARQDLAQQDVTSDLKSGIPAQLLANRPDVQMAELNFRAAFEETNVARTYFYPALTITAGGGFSNLGWSQWFSSQSLFGSIAGGLTQSIFNKGINKARLTAALSRQQQALLHFEKTLLMASLEVSNALFEYDTAQRKELTRKKQLEALTKAVDFNKELFLHHQNTNFTDVLTAEQNLLRAELKNIDDQRQKLSAVVQLYRALGGGWN